MFTHCLSCRTILPESERLGLRVRGDWIAFDPARGRLWSICRRCGSWSLAPIEERWEVAEELERLTSGDRRSPTRARLLSRTDTIALFEIERLHVVRVGESNRTEEAWWRYGAQLQRRWQAEKRVTVGAAAALGAAIVGGVLSWTLPARYAFRDPGEVRRWLTFGDRAWTGRKACARCGHPFTELSYFDRKILRLRRQVGESPGPSISRRCPGCGDADDGGLHLTGLDAEQTLGRVLAYQHHPAVPEPRIRDATNLIEREGDASRLAGVLVRHTRQFDDLPPAATVALEIAVNEARERQLLGYEMADLERYWREAEALASIVDGELTPVSRIDSLRRRAVPGA